jgi:hypothetical protein
MPPEASRRALLVAFLAISAGTAMAAEQPLPRGKDTLKQRLSDKASDEQRVNDCHVAPEKRSRPRPGCPGASDPPADRRQR